MRVVKPRSQLRRRFDRATYRHNPGCAIMAPFDEKYPPTYVCSWTCMLLSTFLSLSKTSYFILYTRNYLGPSSSEEKEDLDQRIYCTLPHLQLPFRNLESTFLNINYYYLYTFCQFILLDILQKPVVHPKTE